MTGGRKASVLTLMLVACALMGACAEPAATASPRRSGFVGTDGRAFVIDDRESPLRGINIYNAASRGNCWFDMQTRLDGDLATIEAESDGAANVIRVWFFQSLATRNGERDWSQLDRVLASARARGFRVIPVLADQWGACEGREGSGGPYKDLTWYQEGYTEPDPGGTVSYRDWVSEVATRYADDPTVAMWGLVNEAEASTGKGESCPPGAAEALAAFADDVGGVIDDADPDHLVALSAVGRGQCGTAEEDYALVHSSPRIDVCEYHDYDLEPVPGDASNGLAAQLRRCAGLRKPLLVAESGIRPDQVDGLDGRAGLYRQKLGAQVPAGIAGLLMWGWSPIGNAGSGDGYGIGAGDPSLPVLAEYSSASG